MKLIDADAAIDVFDKLCDANCVYSKKQRAVMCGACLLGSAFDVIDELPTAERKGHWTIGKDSIGHKRLICTLCGNGIAYMRKFDYCPNCGARMERE